jgi:hypothetical protein
MSVISDKTFLNVEPDKKIAGATNIVACEIKQNFPVSK